MVSEAEISAHGGRFLGSTEISEPQKINFNSFAKTMLNILSAPNSLGDTVKSPRMGAESPPTEWAQGSGQAPKGRPYRGMSPLS